MTATMKGLLKGLRYISQIFEASDEEEEPEMQIGNPTDVKHVAHIGWDGPTVNSPSWMNEFKSSSESSSAPLNSAGALNDNSITKRHSEDVQKHNAPKLEKPSLFSSLDATSPTPEDRKQSRRRHSASGSINSPGRDIINGLKPRRHHQTSLGAVSSTNSIPSESASASIPKKSRRKKSKDASVDGSIKSGGGLTNEGSSKSSSGSSSKSRLKVRKSSEPKSVLSDPRPSLTELDSPTSAFRALALNEKTNQDLDF